VRVPSSAASSHEEWSAWSAKAAATCSSGTGRACPPLPVA
jgi:hypothetical protein